MLSSRYRPLYEELQQRFGQLQALVTQSHPDTGALKAEFLTVQQFFQLQILSLEHPNEEPVASRIQSLHTEINKQLRLLGVDVSFLQAARQPTTQQQRQAQMRDRLTILMGYCEGLLTSASDPG